MNRLTQHSSRDHCDREILMNDEPDQIRHIMKLSDRELEITQHIFDDKKAERIAAEPGISVPTVNTYMQRLYTKLDVRSGGPTRTSRHQDSASTLLKGRTREPL